MSYYPIELDKTRNLKYGMRALDRIEKKLKKKLSKVDLNDLSMEETAVVIWAGLVHEDNKLTVERVMDLVDEYSNLTEIGEHMGRAMNDAFGITETEAAGTEGKNE